MAPDPSLLLRRVGTGDERALRELYERYGAVVYGFVRRRVRDRGLAEEVCGDVWLGCWRSAQGFRGDSQVLTWLLGIARRQAHTHLRGIRLPTVPLDDKYDVAGPESEDPANIVAEAAAAQSVTSAIEALPTELYEVVTLAWLHGLPYAEVAVAVGIPVGTVKSRVSRARAILQSQIRGNHGS
ncbi:RNA polymerase sigma factor [Leucobacter sp. BZR 635]